MTKAKCSSWSKMQAKRTQKEDPGSPYEEKPFKIGIRFRKLGPVDPPFSTSASTQSSCRRLFLPSFWLPSSFFPSVRVHYPTATNFTTTTHYNHNSLQPQLSTTATESQSLLSWTRSRKPVPSKHAFWLLDLHSPRVILKLPFALHLKLSSRVGFLCMEAIISAH